MVGNDVYEKAAYGYEQSCLVASQGDGIAISDQNKVRKQRQGNFWKLASGDERTHDAPTGKTPVRFLVVASVVVAALRGFSHLGLWGEGYIGPSVDHVGDYLFVAIALAL